MIFKYYTTNLYTWCEDNKTSQVCGHRSFRVFFWQSPFNKLHELQLRLEGAETLADIRRI